jgi:DNA-directed RNA polymerase specialized sigma24 family protein
MLHSSMPDLETKIVRFQTAALEGRRDECTDLFPEIKGDCRNVVIQVSRSYSQLGSFVEDVADEVLVDCINAYKQLGFTFRAFYRKSLTNRAVDEHRGRRRLRYGMEFDKTAAPENPSPTEEVRELLELYAVRKRRLLDQIGNLFQPRAKFSTLLLDQRHRMANVSATSRHMDCDKSPSEWVEQLEKWHVDDHERELDIGEPKLGAIWTNFAPFIDNGRGHISQRELVAAIANCGAQVEVAAWRQRVCRYVHDLRDQLDDQELVYFHLQPRG